MARNIAKKKPRYRVKIKKVSKSMKFSYKRIGELKRFTNDQGMIYSRFDTHLSQKQQRRLAVAIKRARHLAMLPFTQTL